MSYLLTSYHLHFSFCQIWVILLYLSLLLLCQTSGQSPVTLVCPWMKRSVCVACVGVLHLCSVTGLHCVWDWWIGFLRVWINETAGSSAELRWFTPPWRPCDAIPDRSFQAPFDRLSWLLEAGMKPWGAWPVLVYSKSAHNCNKTSLLWTRCSSSSVCTRLGDWSWLIVANVAFWDI